MTGTLVGLGELALVGPSLTGELHVAEATRIDFSASASFGALLDTNTGVEAFELGAGPAHRFPISNLALELDVSAFAKAGVLSFSRVSGGRRYRGTAPELVGARGCGGCARGSSGANDALESRIRDRSRAPARARHARRRQ